jgi:FixJ family two-component response regulator
MVQKNEIKRILVVDDEQEFCAMLTGFLQSSGYECQSSTDPLKALSTLKQGDFELVISDVVMPGMDGLQLLSLIPGVDPALDVIIMTGFTEDYSYSDIIKAGAVDFISKPFFLSELKAKVERANRERKMQRDLQEFNIALKVLLQKAEKDRQNFSRDIISNVKGTIFPYLEKLKSFRISEEAKMYIGILETNLSDICSPLMRNLSSKYAQISSAEAQVANLIKAGRRNKEIASILGVSLSTVMTHRHRIRSKLGLKQKKVNLKSYLDSIDF